MNSRLRFTNLCLIVLCIILQSGVVSAQQKIQVVTEYLPPYQLIAENGEVYGFAPEVVDRLFEIAGYVQERRVLPWARAYETALKGNNVMIFSLARTHIREQQFHWVGELLKERLYFWGRKNKFEGPISNYETLSRFQVAVAIGDNPEQYLSSQNFPRLYRVNSAETALAMLLKGRTDLVVASKMEFSEQLQKFGEALEDFVPVFEIDAMNSQLSIAFSLDTVPTIVESFRTAHQQLIGDGELQALRDKWLLTE